MTNVRFVTKDGEILRKTQVDSVPGFGDIHTIGKSRYRVIDTEIITPAGAPGIVRECTVEKLEGGMHITCDDCDGNTFHILFQPPLRGFAECTSCGNQQEIGSGH